MARTRQYSDRVNVIKRIKLGAKWPFAAVVERNGKIVRDHVLVNGRDEHHPEGRYYLEWYEAGKRRRQSVPRFEDLIHVARSKSIEGNARKAGILLELSPASARCSDVSEVELATASGTDRLTMAAAIDQYLDFCKKQRSLRTYRTYRPALKNRFPPEMIWNLCHQIARAYRAARDAERQIVYQAFADGRLNKRRRNHRGHVEMIAA